jgi:broad specificity phosphatase PhoE
MKEVTGGSGEPITEQGHTQIEKLCQMYLKNFIHPNIEIRTNKVIQVHETARILANKLNIPYLIDKNLCPAHMGILNGLSRFDADNLYPELSERMKRWRNGEIEACELNVPGMKNPQVYWKERIDHLISLCDGKPKIIVCSRSIMVWAHNFVNNHTPNPGGLYKHVAIDNCDLISFTFDPCTHKHFLLQEFTTVKNK